VADLAVTGATNRQIADQLFLSPYTVATHMKHVFGKLGVNSRVEMARLAPTSVRAE
jgi:DNA-binding CsgD family transcriptional regulator